MNVVFLSPHFPANHQHYCARLRERGVSVLGHADAAWERLAPEQQRSLTEYYRVPSLEDYEAVYRAVAHFIHRHGRIDRVESQAEFWMPFEARLREDFRIPGRLPADLAEVQRKSVMKQRFAEAGVPVARGRLVRLDRPEEARAFLREIGGPIVAKPDTGVGGSATWRIETPEDLERVRRDQGQREYFLEEYIDGTIVTFDGLADTGGEIVFAGSMEYSVGVMEAINQERDLYYFTHRAIPAELEELGRRALRAFEVRDGFFHFEFFRLADRSYVALEANLRPPGAWSIDMLNYGGAIDLYAVWADMVVGRAPAPSKERPLHCAYAGRKDTLRHRLSHDEVLERFGRSIVFHTPVPRLFRGGMGDYAYLFCTPSLEEVHASARAILEPA
jgi:hypothetical protein